MTREEIIKWLESLKAEIGKSEHGTLWHYAEAIDMAMKALKKEAERQKMIIRASEKHLGLVRCKDCRHRCKDPIYSKADPHWVIYQIGDCPIICKTVGDDDYCSFGERREDEHKV